MLAFAWNLLSFLLWHLPHDTWASLASHRSWCSGHQAEMISWGWHCARQNEEMYVKTLRTLPLPQIWKALKCRFSTNFQSQGRMRLLDLVVPRLLNKLNRGCIWMAPIRQQRDLGQSKFMKILFMYKTFRCVSYYGSTCCIDLEYVCMVNRR